MQLSSIFIADPLPDGSPPALPAAVLRNLASFKAQHPDLPHRLYDRAALRAFLHAEMAPEVLWAFDQLLPYAYKADLARLCLLYVHGGVYADLSVFFTGAWDPVPGKVSVFRDRAVGAPWIASNTILAAPPRFPAIEAAIRMIVANCRNRRRGTNPLYPTGPLLLGKALAMHCEPEQIRLGEVTNIGDRDGVTSLVFADTETGQVIACRAKNKPGLGELGLRHGVNDYNRFYYAGTIFANDFPLTMPPALLRASPQVRGAAEDGLLVFRGDASAAGEQVVVHAGLVPFVPGDYRITAHIESASAGSLLRLIVRGAGGEELAQESCHAGPDTPPSLSLALRLAATRDDLLLTLTVSAGGGFSLRGLSIHRATPAQESVAAPSHDTAAGTSGMQAAFHRTS